MSREIYSYTLTILEKVSFDTGLFITELKKATRSLLPYELGELQLWVNRYVFVNPHLETARLVLKPGK